MEDCAKVFTTPTERIVNNQHSIMVVNPLNTSTDGRKSNAGSSIRTRYAATAKAKIITMYEMESEKLSIPQFAKKHNLPDKFKQYLGTHKGG